MDILKGENFSSIEVANMDLNYWSFCLSSRKGGVGVMDLELRYHFFSQLVQHPSNNTLSTNSHLPLLDFLLHASKSKE